MNISTLDEFVVSAAALHADRVAVRFVGGDGGSLRYRELVSYGAELSGLLREHCRGSGGLVGLYCHTDLHLPVWILGILQFPAAYVPLNPDAPGRLSARVITQCDLKLCAVQSDLLERFQNAFAQLVTMETSAVLSSYNLTLVQVKPIPEAGKQQEGTGSPGHALAFASATGSKVTTRGDLAYVLHTSGTTGLPKIVRVPHKCIVPNILHLRSLFQLSAEDVVFLASPLTFDPSVVEIFLALSSGAELLIVPHVIRKVPSRLAEQLFKNHKATVLQMTPSLLGGLGPSVLQDQVLSRRSRVRVLVLGGEAFPSLSLLRSWRQNGNRTQIYNIYGITEVSCWACCHRVPQHLLLADQVDSLVPLGDALMGTSVEVRDEKNEVVTEGEGQVFLGGEHRVCLIDGERTLISGTMRPTGDWVRVRDRQIHFLGRRDRLIKRLGQRVNLDTVQQMAITLPQVASCAVGLYKGFRLVAFAVVSPPADRRPENLLSVQQHVEPGLPTSISPQGDFTSSRVPQGDGGLRGELQGDGDLQEDLQGDAGLQRAILQQFRLLLPSSSVPDSLLILPALPLTPHGKVDMAALMNIYQKQRERSETRSSLQNLTQLKQRLTALWQDVLGLPEDATVADGSSFLFSGGDSLKALRLCDDLTTVVGLSSPGLLGVLLDGSFSDVLRHVATVTGMILPLEDGRQAKKRPAEPPVDVPNKREHREPGGAGGPTSGEGRVKVIRRAGQVIVMNIRNSKQDTVEQHRTPDSTKTTNNSVTAGTSMEGVGDVAPPTGHTGDMELSLLWSSDTGRCVDASPVLLVRGGGVDQNSQGGALATVFIGSHSHRLQALDLATGAVQWERVLGDRIESSAAVTRCGGLVVVGCYDGGVYFLCVASGETRWLFETGDAVKSSPTVDPATGMVLVGSHDGHLYALNPQLHVCVWRRHCGGAVFSSPFLEQNQRRLYVASLSGTLLCLDPDDGAVLWTYDRETPFFSSPIGSSGRVVIGSVDGNICAFSDMGKLLWQFGTGGPVFSSPCVMPDQQRVLCGSHDGHLYCLELANGSVVWRFQTPGRVYASPCLLEGSAAGRRGVLVGLASTDGTVWILDVRDGKQLASITLPGEVFSSPVAWEHSLVVGCRNDMVYCMQLAARRDAEER